MSFEWQIVIETNVNFDAQNNQTINISISAQRLRIDQESEL